MYTSQREREKGGGGEGERERERERERVSVTKLTTSPTIQAETCSAVVGLLEWHKDHRHHHARRLSEPTAETAGFHWLPYTD